MAEYRIIRRAEHYIVQEKSWRGWVEPFLADNPHETLGQAQWWRGRLLARDESQPYEVIE